MFELGRELKRLFRPVSAFAPPRDGLAGGDPGLLELLDMDMLRAEAKAADVAAGRISARDRPMLQLRQATVWREIARRTGDEAALRKAAAAAEGALGGLDRRHHAEAWARVRIEQAACATLSIEFGADEGLAAAASRALTEAMAAAARTGVAAYAQVMRAMIIADEALMRGEPEGAQAAAAEAGAAIPALENQLKERPARRKAALARFHHAEILAACGRQARDERLLDTALTEAVRAALALDPAYEPVTWSRTTILRGEILTAVGELTADAGALDRAVQILASVFEHLLRDHSPLDWAVAQHRLGRALAVLAEATGKADILEQARAAYDRALVVLHRLPTHPLRAATVQSRAGALCRQAEMLGDRLALDAAEAEFRCELAAVDPKTDPVSWGVCQVNLAHAYLARVSLSGRDRGERAKAGMALDAAFEVFAEHGLHSLAAVASSSLERLRATA